MSISATKVQGQTTKSPYATADPANATSHYPAAAREYQVAVGLFLQQTIEGPICTRDTALRPEHFFVMHFGGQPTGRYQNSNISANGM